MLSLGISVSERARWSPVPCRLPDVLEAGGGTLVIEVAEVFLDEGYASAHVGVAPGPYAILSVSDTGLAAKVREVLNV